MRVAAFPFLLAVTLAGVYLGTAGGLPKTLVLLGVLGVIALTVALLERVIPLDRRWSSGEVRTDVIYTAVNAALHPAMTAGIHLGAAALATLFATASVWPSHWPLAAQILLALLFRELAHYLVHRVTHERGGLLWRFHAIHHASDRLYWLNANRLHLGNIVVDAVTGIAPLLVLGIGEDALFGLALVIAATNTWAHGNVDFAAGPLFWIFSLPRLHRWHHSRVHDEACHNYGDVLIVWDVLFGTRHDPSAAPDALGLHRGAVLPDGFGGQLVAPFLPEPERHAGCKIPEQ